MTVNMKRVHVCAGLQNFMHDNTWKRDIGIQYVLDLGICYLHGNDTTGCLYYSAGLNEVAFSPQNVH